MSKYLTLGFHLSWIAVLLVLVGFIFELSSEVIRTRLQSGDFSIPGFYSAQYVNQRAILESNLALSSYLANPFVENTNKRKELHTMRRSFILDNGLSTSQLQLDDLIYQKSYWPNLDMNELEQTKVELDKLVEKVFKIQYEDNIQSIKELSNESIILQKKVMGFMEEARIYNQNQINYLEELGVLSNKISTWIVLLAFFITLLVLARIQWLEYYSERRLRE